MSEQVIGAALEPKVAAERLRLFGSIIDAATDGIALLTPSDDPAGPQIAFVNDAFCDLYRVRREQILGQNLTALRIVDRHQAILADMLEHIFDLEPFDAEVTATDADGAEFELDLHLVPVAEAGAITHWIAFVRNVTAAREQIVTLRRQATVDPLTDLPNRASLLDTLDKAIESARQEHRNVALLMMDVDRFKDVNDTFGHQLGDSLLQQIAVRIRALLPPQDTLARLGGDEFAAVLTDRTDAQDVAVVARKVLDALQQPFEVEGHLIEVAASIGIALYPSHGTDVRMLLRRADVAMYAAKEANVGYAFHNRERESRTPEQLALVAEMRRAIERNEFELHYQPKLHLSSGLMTRAEVLIRWRHPRRGLIPPAAFIPVAENTGLIKAMTDWIFDRMLRQCREWHDRGAPVHVAVNISAKSLQEQTLPLKIQNALDKWGIDPRFLKVEITESSIMADPAHALAICSMLQSMGVRLSLDDFGTGYSSLTTLRQLPIDEIKVDKSFVMGMLSSEADTAIVRTMIDLAHNLGKQVCAEGVENAETWNALGEMGCDLAQGYWISKPKPADEFLQWLVDTFWGLRQVRESSPKAAR